MSQLILKSNEKYYIDNEFYTIKKGKVITRYLLANGKVIANEICFSKGDIIGNFFSIVPTKILIPEVVIEIDILEESTLEEISLPIIEEALDNSIIKKLIENLVQKSIIKFLYQLYDSKGYILSILQLYADSKGHLEKKNIKYENFNISRSQFYLIYLNLKKDKFIIENKNIIQLNQNKINQYLENQNGGNFN